MPNLFTDIIIYDTKIIRLWGQVCIPSGSPVPHTTVKLMSYDEKDDIPIYEMIDSTVNDEEGYYLFDFSPDPAKSYQVLVSPNS